MMNRFYLFILLLIGLTGHSQILEPVTWQYESQKISDTEYELKFIATMDENWALYSQFVGDDGPLPTVFNFETVEGIELVEGVVETDLNKVTKFDPVFEIDLTKFFDRAEFIQRIRITDESAQLSGQIEYMTCDDERCIIGKPGEFSFTYSNGVLAVGEVIEETLEQGDNSDSNVALYGMSPSELEGPENNISQGKSLWVIFGIGFIGGLLALLTPCVFPMIPLTVSFFTKKNEQDNSGGFSKAVLYGFFILAVYLVLSAPFHLLDSVNPDILNDISTNVTLNIIFFLIFVIFAFSFFGYYELTLPASWTSKTTQGENIGGVVGVFFMALTLAIVSFSCTGPILGSLLAGSLTADGGAWQLTAGMGGFGFALGLPFALFAAFPSWLNSLPKSGGWLNTTKVVLGFLELALAFKFLSNADLVKQWGLLKIEVFLAIWIIIFLGMALYLFGKIKFPHDSPIRKLSFFRVSFGVLTVAFVIYLASGFMVNSKTNTYHSLKLLSGLAPPVGYSWFYKNDSPNDLESFKDFKEGILYAQEVNKPIMLDFTGYACVNCRKMEEHVWSLESIDGLIRENYVLISLYVDDKRALPEEQQIEVFKSSGGKRGLKNYGHKWAHFQTEFFGNNSQPYYVLLNPSGTKVLNDPVGYTPDEDEYAEFLKSGLESFKSLSAKSQVSFDR